MRRMMTEERCGNMQGTMTGKNYRAVTDPEEARDYIRDAKVVAFDFEVAPDPSYRKTAHPPPPGRAGTS